MKRKLVFSIVIVIGMLMMSVYILFENMNRSSNTGTSIVKGSVSIKKYPGNQTCFKIETPEGVRIITDPCNMNEDLEADIVTESHKEADHTDTSRISGNYKLFDMIGSYMVKGVKVEGFLGAHDKGEYFFSNIIYIFTAKGVRIAQFASQGPVPDQDTLKQIGSADVLIIQFSEMTDIKLSPREAYGIAKRLGAKIVIPAHGNTDMNDEFSELFGQKKAERIPSGQMLVTKKELDAQKDTRVVVLDNFDMQGVHTAIQQVDN